MENQHRKIKGYRELSREEINLMNRIKDKGAELLALQAELVGRLNDDAECKMRAAMKSLDGMGNNGRPCSVWEFVNDECREYRRFHEAEPQRWAAIGKTDIQTGIMALVRAVAQPAGV